MPAAQRRLPLCSRGPPGTEPQHQRNARTGRRGSEHGMKLLLGGPGRASEIHAGGHDQRVAGVCRKCYGSTRRHPK